MAFVCITSELFRKCLIISGYVVVIIIGVERRVTTIGWEWRETQAEKEHSPSNEKTGIGSMEPGSTSTIGPTCSRIKSLPAL